MIEYIEEIRNIIANNPKNYIKVLKSKGFHKGVKSNEHLVRFIEENTKLLANSIYTKIAQDRCYIFSVACELRKIDLEINYRQKHVQK